MPGALARHQKLPPKWFRHQAMSMIFWPVDLPSTAELTAHPARPILDSASLLQGALA